jgi:prolipoprotein diacylglyceryltransferase
VDIPHPILPCFLHDILPNSTRLFFEGLVLFIYMQIRFWSRKRSTLVRLSEEFLILYSILRISTEIFREPDAQVILSMSRGQFYSIFLLLICIILFKMSTNKIPKAKLWSTKLTIQIRFKLETIKTFIDFSLLSFSPNYK